jgi:uncharacterized protein (TIGR02246 family)
MKRLLVLFVLFIAACASSTQSDAPVRAAMAGFMDALNSLDADRMAAYFADDVTAFVPIAQADRVNGKAAVVAVFRSYAETTKKSISRTNIIPEDLRVDLYGDTAIVTFNVRNPSSTARRTWVFRQMNGKWLITHFHASNFTSK